MALSATDRWRILQNIIAQKGTDNVDLYAELAKTESMINFMDTDQAMRTAPNVAPTPTPTPTPTLPQEPLKPI